MTDKLTNIKSPGAYKEEAFSDLLRNFKDFLLMADDCNNPSDKRVVFMIKAIMEYLQVAERPK